MFIHPRISVIARVFTQRSWRIQGRFVGIVRLITRDRNALKNTLIAFIRHKVLYSRSYSAIIHLTVIGGNEQSVCWMKAVLVGHYTKSVKLGALLCSNWYIWDMISLPDY